jgi:hypothetical protein
VIEPGHPLDVMAGLVLPDARPWGEAAVDLQWRDARAFHEGRRLYLYLVRARGWSKTDDTAGLLVSDALTGPRGARSFWIAADREQGEICLQAIAGFCQRTPWLAPLVEVQSRRAIFAETGAEIVVLAADAASSWGLRGRTFAADEFAYWPMTSAADELWTAIRTAAAKFADTRLVVITAPSSPNHRAYRELEHARTSGDWYVSEVKGPPPWLDPAKVAEQRAALPEGAFRRLFGGEWTTIEGSFFTPGAVDRAFSLPGPTMRPEPRRTYRAGLDLGHVADRTAFAVCHEEAGGVVLDAMATWAGSPERPVAFGEVEEAVAVAHRRFRCRVRLDPWQALHLAERLEARGVPVETYTFTTQSKQRLASTLLGLLNDGRLALFDHPGLRDELKGLRIKETPSGFAFDHPPGRGHHDDMATALSLAAVGALEDRSLPGRSLSGIPDRLTRSEHEARQVARREEARRRDRPSRGPAPFYQRLLGR